MQFKRKYVVFLITWAFLIPLLIFPSAITAQSKTDWQHLDPEKDSVLGVSTNRAYELLKNRESKPVIVAIIDNGAELTHQDLQGQFWINTNEIAGNGIDDDKNGYIDDIHGWNFLGNQKGENIKRETTELTRLYGSLSKRFENVDREDLAKNELHDFETFLKIKQIYQQTIQQKEDEVIMYQNILWNCLQADRIIKELIRKESYSENDLRNLSDTNFQTAAAAKFMIKIIKADLSIPKIEAIIENNKLDLETRLNPAFNIRNEIIGDNPADLKDNKYGNSQVNSQSPYHGTGVAGIIGALHNGFGVDGIAKKVKMMIIRALPNGDERDKDIALAILYAIDNHADIINCSFGKAYTSHPEFVEYAMKKAEKAGVLIVHASGNYGANNDSIPTYPTGFYANGTRAKNWINVGACQSKDDENIIASFSNYGKKSVDIFAPGVDINSCALNSNYESGSGTSIAAPIVSGIAAVLKSYYPKLNAVQIKEIIIQSAWKPETDKTVLVGQNKKKLQMKDISVSGGIANLYQSILFIENKKKN